MLNVQHKIHHWPRSSDMTTHDHISIEPPVDGRMTLFLKGTWKLGDAHPDAEQVVSDLSPTVRQIRLDAHDIASYDSALLTFLLKFNTLCEQKRIAVDDSGLPEGVRKLIALARAVPEKKDARKQSAPSGMLAAFGKAAQDGFRETLTMIAFLGESALALGRWLTGRARCRFSDILLHVQECGPQSLPIISLISALVGLILAFVGAIQLRMFGAEIFVANLVGLGMAREMGAMMAAIILAGRTGAAYAAQLGTMQVNEEIDALVTLGVSPMEFLVLPRMLALAFMMPILCLYADLMGIFGGALVAVLMLDISPAAYLHQTQTSVPLHHFATGLIKSVFFGVIVAYCGCLRGMQCGRSASAVGVAATSAVVLAIVFIILCDATFTVIFSILDI